MRPQKYFTLRSILIELLNITDYNKFQNIQLMVQHETKLAQGNKELKSTQICTYGKLTHGFLTSDIDYPTDTLLNQLLKNLDRVETHKSLKLSAEVL